MNDIFYAKTAARQLRKLPAADSKRIRTACRDLENMPDGIHVKALTTSQSASLAVHGEVKRGSHPTEPKAPLICGGEAPTARSGFFTNHAQQYRLRVGNFRVFFDFDGAAHIVSIEDVRKRDDRTYQ